MSVYSVDYEAAARHIPAHPDRTVSGTLNPLCVYFREFSSRAAMERWLSKQTAAARQNWRPWLASARHRQMLAQAERHRAEKASCPEQFSLFSPAPHSGKVEINAAPGA